MPELKDGQALARVKYLSIDPTMRVWMVADTYLPAVAIGEVMRAIGFAEIIESRHPDYKKGDRVTGLTGLQEYVVLDESAKVDFAVGCHCAPMVQHGPDEFWGLNS